MHVQANPSQRFVSSSAPAPSRRVAYDPQRDSFGPIPTVSGLACNTGMNGALREPRRLALLHQGGDPDVVAALVRDNLRFATSDDEARFVQRVRESAREAGVAPQAVEKTSQRVLRDVAAITVERSLRGPMARALVRGLTLRNDALERIANDPTTSRDEATTARWHLRENDVLIHALQNGELRGDLYRVDPELARQVIAGEPVGLADEAYPFAGVKAQTFAQAAVLREVREAQQLEGKVAVLLERAARATRTAPPDTLELVETARCR